jgi:RES domain-containing protein
MVPPSYRLGIYEIPENVAIEKLESKHWPADWAEFPYPQSTQTIGDGWLKAKSSLGLIVPSCAVSPGLGDIMVVNPLHQDIGKVTLVDTRSDIFNPRAFPGLKDQ